MPAPPARASGGAKPPRNGLPRALAVLPEKPPLPNCQPPDARDAIVASSRFTLAAAACALAAPDVNSENARSDFSEKFVALVAVLSKTPPIFMRFFVIAAICSLSLSATPIAFSKVGVKLSLTTNVDEIL